MSESVLHRHLKFRVWQELKSEGYMLFHEPAYPPAPNLNWSAYRPDLFGIRRTREEGQDFVIVECETRPNMRRFNSKNFKKMWLQTRLFREDRLRKILAIPSGKLKGVDSGLRTAWEIWVMQEHGGCSVKIPLVAEKHN